MMVVLEQGFSRQIDIFVTFLGKIRKEWPSETAVIAHQLDRYGRHISQISHHYQESVGVAQPDRSFDGLEGHPLPGLPSSTAIFQHNFLTLDQQHLDDNIPMISSLSSGARDGIFEDLPNQIAENTMLSASSQACQNNNDQRSDFQVVPIPCGSEVETVPHLAPGPWQFQGAVIDTIDPKTLHLDCGNNHHEQTGTISDFRSDSNLSSGFDTPMSSTEPANRAALSARSSNRTRGVKRVQPHGILSEQSVASRCKRLKSQRTPSCSAEDYAKLRDDLVRILDQDDMDDMPTMCDLYHATASKDAIFQLKDIISAIRRADSWTPGLEFSSVFSTVCALDKLDVMQHSTAFFRRVLLVRLADHRHNKMKELETQKADTTTTQPSSVRRKPGSQVLDILQREAYPDTDRQLKECDNPELREKYGVERKALRNRLTSARNWRCAVNLFGFGILALIPTGGCFQIQNQRHVCLHHLQKLY
jgi:hypothetical protein